MIVIMTRKITAMTTTKTTFATNCALTCTLDYCGCLLVACLTSLQQASVSQGRICSDNCTCCHTGVQAADPTCCLIHSQHTDTGPTSPRAVSLKSQQHASVSQVRICSDNFKCCHTEIEVADPTFYLTQSQYTETGPTSPTADPVMPGAWQGSH